MKLRSKAALAAGAVLSTVSVLGTSPAHAETHTSQAQRDLTFHRGGVEVTCTYKGTSTYEFQTDSDGTVFAFMTATTALIDDDPACHDALLENVAQGFYFHGRRHTPEEAGRFEASARVDTVTARALVQDIVPSRVTGFHLIRFECDEAPDTGCATPIATSPK
jgi:hypothetical protein